MEILFTQGMDDLKFEFERVRTILESALASEGLAEGSGKQPHG
jgi:hypothetical protein